MAVMTASIFLSSVQRARLPRRVSANHAPKDRMGWRIAEPGLGSKPCLSWQGHGPQNPSSCLSRIYRADSLCVSAGGTGKTCLAVTEKVGYGTRCVTVPV
ncbi:uncharacterized protein CIMG_12684 [Coccidioides immitis RS]|uniref:Uncharacterized protein n=1 Tax=Coccidioides immitis (strain RS) TaxID=246410 RepID=J3KLC3_COCIM|nr:uncharacterized protein CIMG_12684 [Coccidioides immitis RS]EAS37065.3 hypothetical protein CIMG_12684 [Coccidioides immitis RS]